MQQNLPQDWQAVSVVNVANPALTPYAGTMSPSADGVHEITLQLQSPDSAEDVQPGARLVIREGEWFWSAEVLSRQGDRLSVAERRMRRCERRTYPRVQGALAMRYRPMEEGDLEALTRDYPEDAWRCAASKMNLSVTGLRFLGTGPLKEQSRLLCEISTPSLSWRCTARVVRVEPYPFGGSDVDLHFVAVVFEQLPPDAAEELTQYTLQIQRDAFD